MRSVTDWICWAFAKHKVHGATSNNYSSSIKLSKIDLPVIVGAKPTYTMKYEMTA